MSKYLWSGPLVAAALIAAIHFHDLGQRVAELESAPRFDPQALDRLDRGLAGLESELGVTRRAIEADTTAEELREELQQVESELEEAYALLDLHSERIRSWDRRWAGRGPAQLEASIEDLRRAVEERWSELDEIAESAARVAEEDRDRIEALDASLTTLNVPRDQAGMWHELVGPVVQIAGDATVGSGVLLESQRIHGTDDYVTYLLTSWHVVRDIYGTLDRVNEPVDVKVYLEGGSTAMETATMLSYDVALDVALLRLQTDARVQFGARLPTRERLENVRIFDRVYAVGCPLGNDPIPTAGEVAATTHVIDGETYWMISAPTYIGNSGGGIFDADSHELLGIFSKIYTHGSMRATIVPHMGLVTPLEQIYDWFETTDYAYLSEGGSFDEAPAPTPQPEPTVATAAAR